VVRAGQCGYGVAARAVGAAARVSLAEQATAERIEPALHDVRLDLLRLPTGIGRTSGAGSIAVYECICNDEARATTRSISICPVGDVAALPRCIAGPKPCSLRV